MSERVYHQRVTAFLDYAKGGYSHVFDILDSDKVIGTKTVLAETRSSPIQTIYAIGDMTFDTAKDFIAAYEDERAHPARAVPIGRCPKCKVDVIVDLPNRCPDKNCPALVPVEAARK